MLDKFDRQCVTHRDHERGLPPVRRDRNGEDAPACYQIGKPTVPWPCQRTECLGHTRTELVTHFPNSRSLSLLLSALFRPIRPRRPTLRATMDSGGQVPGGAPQGSPITKNTKRTHFPP